MTPVRVVIVAVPARNEAAALPACLDALMATRAEALLTRPTVQIKIVVALDTCTDASAAVVARYPVIAVHTQCGNVGGTRDAAILTGLSRFAPVPSHEVWLANTDADSAVPVHWLSTQLELAESGRDLVIGTVEPCGALDEGVLRRWQERHTLTEGHRHVHGANLGVRASAWQSAGGFGNLPLHEDLRLVRTLQRRVSFIATDRTRVRTSARREGRVEGGFAHYLATLEAEPEGA